MLPTPRAAKLGVANGSLHRGLHERHDPETAPGLWWGLGGEPTIVEQLAFICLLPFQALLLFLLFPGTPQVKRPGVEW